MKQLTKIIRSLMVWRRQRDFKTAVRKANYLQSKTFKTHFVYVMEGKFVVIAKQNVKQMYQRGLFKKGMTLTQVYDAALYKSQL